MFRPARLAVMLLVSALALPGPATAASGIALYNGINMDITSLRLRGGTVTGFQRVPPGRGVAIALKMDDGSCAGWIVARTRLGDAANALVDICHAGAYVVTLTPRVGNRGTATDLTIRPLK